MADNNKTSSQIKEGDVVGPPLVQSTTEATPSPADETPMPNHLNTETEQPPVRTGKPQTPIAQTLAAGAGQHTPPDTGDFRPDGRPRDAGTGEAVPDDDGQADRQSAADTEQANAQGGDQADTQRQPAAGRRGR
jgi:hypothetical protein